MTEIFKNAGNRQNKNSWLVLYSGGLDSIVVAHLLHVLGKDITLLHMSYGQQAEKTEFDLTEAYAKHINVPLMNFNVEDTFKSILEQLHTNLASVSRLWDKDAEGGGVGDAESSMSYVPFRNTLFLTISGMVAEQRNIKNITFGSNLSETMTYPDNSEPFLRTMDKMVKVGSNKKNINVRAPLFTLTKTKLIELAVLIGTPFELSTSCYFPLEDGSACGKCGSCTLRMNAFKRCGIIDPGAPTQGDFDWSDCEPYVPYVSDRQTIMKWITQYGLHWELD